jgi:hypothetical protein
MGKDGPAVEATRYSGGIHRISADRAKGDDRLGADNGAL